MKRTNLLLLALATAFLALVSIGTAAANESCAQVQTCYDTIGGGSVCYFTKVCHDL